MTLKISAETHAVLAELAAEDKRAMGEVVAEMTERERRRRFLEGANEDLARLRADPAEWADYRAEIRSMEGTLMDGLDDNPWEE
jgi:hypothetical protein